MSLRVVADSTASDRDHLTIERHGQPLSRRGLLEALATDASFRAFFDATLSARRFPSFFWEMPPFSDATQHRKAEMVVIEARALASLRPDRESFAAQFDAARGAPTTVFTNLGGDATLVVPTPMGEPSAYGHLASFCRTAPAAQRDALWESVGTTALGQQGPRALWISTAGLGVAWLHVRLDARPKYYRHTPFTAV
jgi:hypothetical protein